MMIKSLSPWMTLGLILGILSPSLMADDSQGPFVRMVRHKDGSRTVTAHHVGMQAQEVVTYDADNVVRLKRINHLDKYGRPQSFEFYDGNNRLLMRGKFTFDSMDRMKEELLYTVDGQLIRRLTKNYDLATGKELPPTITGGSAGVPQQILQWSDPDGEGTGTLASGTQGRSGNGNGAQEEDKKKKRGLPFGLFNRKNK